MACKQQQDDKSIIKKTENIFRKEFNDTYFAYYKDIISKEYSDTFRDALIFTRVQNMLKPFEIEDVNNLSFFYSSQKGYIPTNKFKNNYVFVCEGNPTVFDSLILPNFKWLGCHKNQNKPQLNGISQLVGCFEVSTTLNIHILYQFLSMNESRIESDKEEMYFWLRLLLCGYTSLYKLFLVSFFTGCQTIIFNHNKFTTISHIDVTPILEYCSLDNQNIYMQYFIVIAFKKEDIKMPISCYSDWYNYIYSNSSFYTVVGKKIEILSKKQFCTFATCIKKYILKSFDLNELLPIYIKLFYELNKSPQLIIIMQAVHDNFTCDQIKISLDLKITSLVNFDYGEVVKTLCYKSSKCEFEDLWLLNKYYTSQVERHSKIDSSFSDFSDTETINDD